MCDASERCVCVAYRGCRCVESMWIRGVVYRECGISTLNVWCVLKGVGVGGDDGRVCGYTQ